MLSGGECGGERAVAPVGVREAAPDTGGAVSLHDCQRAGGCASAGCLPRRESGASLPLQSPAYGAPYDGEVTSAPLQLPHEALPSALQPTQ